MNRNRNERVAVVVALVVIALFFGGLVVAGVTRSAPAPEGAESRLITTASGLILQDLAVGAGEEAAVGRTVSVHYAGRFPNGTEFDSSRGREPLSFTLGSGEVIPGWDEGIAGMREGGRRLLVVPPHLGYGEKGLGPIPPQATLVFDVELLEVR